MSPASRGHGRAGEAGGDEGPADVEQAGARPLGGPRHRHGATAPGPVVRHSGVLPGLAEPGPTATCTTVGTTAISRGLARQPAALAAPRPVRVRVRRAGGARPRRAGWSPSAGPTSTGSELARPPRAADATSSTGACRPADAKSFDEWRDDDPGVPGRAPRSCRSRTCAACKYDADRRLRDVLASPIRSRSVELVGARPRTRTRRRGYCARARRVPAGARDGRATRRCSCTSSTTRRDDLLVGARSRRSVDGRVTRWIGDVPADGLGVRRRSRRRRRGRRRGRVSADVGRVATATRCSYVANSYAGVACDSARDRSTGPSASPRASTSGAVYAPRAAIRRRSRRCRP